MGIAYKSLCNDFGIIIDDIINGIEGYIVYHYTNSEKHRAKIHYTNSGRAYFKSYGKRHYLDEFIRSDI